MIDKAELVTGVRGQFKEIAIASSGGGGGLLMPRTFGEVVAFAEVMARSEHAIPRHLRGKPGACMAVTMQALRWDLDPFAVASKAYLVNDQIAYEAQLIAAVVHTRAPIKGTPEYRFDGEGAAMGCLVRCTMLDGETREYESPRVGAIPVKNSPLWKSDPKQQLGYYSIRAWARRYTPEVILGVYGRDELPTGSEAPRDVTPASDLRARFAAAPKARLPDAQGFDAGFVEAELVEATGGPETAADDAPEAGEPEAAVSEDKASVLAAFEAELTSRLDAGELVSPRDIKAVASTYGDRIDAAGCAAEAREIIARFKAELGGEVS